MFTRYKHPSTSNQKNVEIHRSRKCTVIEILKSNELEVVKSLFYRVLVVMSKFTFFKNYCGHIRYYYFDNNNNKMKTIYRVYIMEIMIKTHSRNFIQKLKMSILKPCVRHYYQLLISQFVIVRSYQ